MLPISLANYSCQVFVNYNDNGWSGANKFTEAVINKRYANFIVDTNLNHIHEINGFNYGLSFSPTVGTIGINFYALIVCI